MALRGVRVLELAGLAPAPFCGMVLADFGASVIRVDRLNTKHDNDRLSRGKRSIAIDLKKNEGRSLLKKMVDKSDVLIDPFRPDVLEGMGLAPNDLLRSNPKLIVARITGYGQDGPWSRAAGHDINYVATSGVLSMLGKSESPPFPPVNLLADFAGGGLLTAMGICAALFERTVSGKGQIIDTSMSEGAAYVSTFLWRTRSPRMNIPIWFSDRGNNVLDGGTHFYQTYETSDGKFVAVGALEPQFYAEFIRGIGLDPDTFPQMQDMDEAKEVVSKIFKTKTREEWASIFKDTDACVTPVLDFEEVHKNEQNEARDAFTSYDGTLAPRAAPRLSRTPAQIDPVEPEPGEHSLEILHEIGLAEESRKLLEDNIVQIARSKL
ncbi:alpha-methylacyl-CoA racemase [Galendromus occidentalis]|uniref:Alpha-methylacyl-CoA racemase n=1 Tax=Galendromus occidentalis TaxID=34638 RepID=A0AAJ6QP26_9ACAR|nr:alpha-methylacyl-CoA racemase [Galendromus occidentalis]